MKSLYVYKAIIDRVNRPDRNIIATIELGLGIIQRKEIFLKDIVAPKGRVFDDNTYELYTQYVRDMIESKEVILMTTKDREGTYVRVLAEVWINQSLSLNKHLVDNGLAKKYQAGIIEWSDDELQHISNFLHKRTSK